MNLREVFVMNCCFAALYFPTSMLLWLFNQKGTLLGVLLVGLVFHVILTVLLAVLFLKKQHVKRAEIVENAPKRVYKKKNKREVKNGEEETIPVLPTQFFDIREPEPKMRTDVNLDQLNADTDDVLD